MGERKGQNKYYPPDYDPKIHGSLNAYHGTHYLRERARKLDRGIIIMRFEMPYNVWCLGCGRHIAMGVRYNAEKTKVGMYHSTPLFKFRMKCHLCDMHFEIQNDPKNFTYEILSGIRRKEQHFDAAENGAFELEDAETKLRRASDKMFKLEHERSDAQKMDAARPQLERIEQDNSRLRDDFALNQLARSRFRTDKKRVNEAEKATEVVAKRLSLAGSGVRLLESNETDAREAAFIRLGTLRRNDLFKSESARRAAVLKSSIFDAKHVRHTKLDKRQRRKRPSPPKPNQVEMSHSLPNSEANANAASSSSNSGSFSDNETTVSKEIEYRSDESQSAPRRCERVENETIASDAKSIAIQQSSENASLRLLSAYDESDVD